MILYSIYKPKSHKTCPVAEKQNRVYDLVETFCPYALLFGTSYSSLPEEKWQENSSFKTEKGMTIVALNSLRVRFSVYFVVSTPSSSNS